MSSDEERILFETYGWTQDTVKRVWTAPDGETISTDDLVTAAAVLGPRMEQHLIDVVRSHGRKKL